MMLTLIAESENNPRRPSNGRWGGLFCLCLWTKRVPMPNDDMAEINLRISEITKRLSAVEQVIAGHLQGCGEANKHRERWEVRTDANIAVLNSRVNKIANKVGEILKTDARRVGYFMGATAVGSLMGGAIVALLSKMLWGH